MRVDPYAYHAQALAAVLAEATAEVDYTQPLARLRGERDPRWLERATVYGAFIRLANVYTRCIRTAALLGLRRASRCCHSRSRLPRSCARFTPTLVSRPPWPSSAPRPTWPTRRPGRGSS